MISHKTGTREPLTYSAGQWPPPARGVEFMTLYYGFLDRAPFGGNEGTSR